MSAENGWRVKSAVLETVCGTGSALPHHELPEYAFAGRSNVGKSSLINYLLGRKSLARTSAQPGKTQTINYYNVNGEFYLVDLPGYGFAKASRSARAAWGRMAERYLKESRTLRRIFLLVDMRHAPTADDKLMCEWMISQGFEPVIIATKADKLGKNDKVKNMKLIRETLNLTDDDIVIPVSSSRRIGAEEIYKLLLDKES